MLYALIKSDKCWVSTEKDWDVSPPKEEYVNIYTNKNTAWNYFSYEEAQKLYLNVVGRCQLLIVFTCNTLNRGDNLMRIHNIMMYTEIH